MKIIFMLLFLLLFGSFQGHAAERVDPVFDGRTWKVGFSQNQGGAVMEEYVLENEVVENWSELVTIQFLPGLNKRTNPEVFEAMQKNNMMTICPQVEWTSIRQTQDEAMWKWSITGCQGQKDQSEIARLVRTDEGFHLWHYAIKQAPMPADKEATWLGNLNALKVIKE